MAAPRHFGPERARGIAGLMALAGLLPFGAKAGDFSPVAGIPKSLQGELEIRITHCRPVTNVDLLEAALRARVTGPREIAIDRVECGAYRPGTDEVKRQNAVAGLRNLQPGKTAYDWVLFPFDETFSECRCVASGVRPLALAAAPGVPTQGRQQPEHDECRRQPLPPSSRALRYERVDVEMANVREGPSVRCSTVGQAPRGAIVDVLEDRNHWEHVRVRDRDVEGWIRADLTREGQAEAPTPPAEAHARREQESVRHGDAGETVGHDEPEGHAAPLVPGGHFGARSIHEAHAGGHLHAVVTVDGGDLLVLRDESVYKTTLDRAEALARALEETLHQGDRVLIFRGSGGAPGIYVVSHHGGFPRLILRVTPADAVAYSRKSGRHVSQTLLGEWWTALLRDFFSVLFEDHAPRFITGTHEGEALILLRSRLSQIDADSRPPTARIEEAIAGLSEETRNHLGFLAARVPGGFAVKTTEERRHEDLLEPL